MPGSRRRARQGPAQCRRQTERIASDHCGKAPASRRHRKARRSASRSHGAGARLRSHNPARHALTVPEPSAMVAPERPGELSMDVYLPIAEMSVNLFLLLGLGGAVGFLSGVFGVGGGFLMTPLLIFIGIPPAVAVGSEASQILASSFSGGIAHARRGNVDFRMGSVLVAGGLVGSAFGVWLFAQLRQMGQIDVVISLAYVVFLGTVGALMLVEFGAGVVPGARPARHLYQAASPPLAPWPAAQDQVPPLAPVHQRVHAARPRLLRRHPRLDHGGRRRLSHGPGDDLPDRHADRGGGRDLAVPDQLRDRGHHLSCTRSTTTRSTSSWRWR